MALLAILIAIAVVIVAVISIDAWLRRRGRKKEEVVRVPHGPAAEENFNPELPGKVRVMRREPTFGIESAVRTVQTGSHAARTDLQKESVRTDTQDHAAQEHANVPMLVETAQGLSPVVTESLAFVQSEPVVKVEQVDMFGDVEIPAAQPAPAREIKERGEPLRRHDDIEKAEQAAKEAAAKSSKKSGPEEVIVVHVMGRGGERFSGKALLQSALESGLRFGDYNIFHRYETAAHDAPAMFSMANAVEPGVFDLDAMEAQSYVGVSFFLMLPGPSNSRFALDSMIEAARNIAKAVGADLLDQQHSGLTPQTVEHLRQRVMEYERRRLARLRAND